MKHAHITCDIMDHLETKDFTGLVIRKPTEEELDTIISHFGCKVLFNEFVFNNPAKFGLDPENLAAITAFLDHSETYNMSYYDTLQINGYEDLQMKLMDVKKHLLPTYEDAVTIYDLQHIKIRFITVIPFLIFAQQHSRTFNRLSMAFKVGYLCSTCHSFHDYEPGEILSFK